MTTKANQPRPKECEQCADKNLEVDCWNPDRMLDALMNNHDKVEQDWIEKIYELEQTKLCTIN